VNLATRVFVDTGERVAVAGFIITGDVSKKVLLRGIGPSLAANGVPTPLANPTLTLFDSGGNVVMTNDDWKNSPDATEIMNTGIAPKNDLESAIISSLAPGTYTVALAGKDGGTGNGLVEVYDLAAANNSTLANVSTRGYVGAGDNAMIGGFIIGSGEYPIVVLRALGPSIAAAGIAEPLLDPTIELHDQDGTVLASNDDWKQGQPQSVVATQLAPGKNDTTGVALFEAYRLP
jgi:hypothetical protein